MRPPRYLGDGVYVEEDGLGRIRLYVSNGIVETEQIYLDVDIIEALSRWAG